MKKIYYVVIAITALLTLTSCSSADNSRGESSVPSDNSSVSSTELSDSSTVSDENGTDHNSGVISSGEDVPSDDDISEKNEEIAKFVDVSSLTKKSRANIIDVLTNDPMTMDVSVSVTIMKGITAEFDVVLSKYEDQLYQSISLGGQTLSSVKRADGSFVSSDGSVTDGVNPEFEALTGKAVSYITSHFGLEGIEFVSEGTEEYEGKSYSYEEYKSPEASIKLYYDGNMPKYLVSTNKKNNSSVITVKKLVRESDPCMFPSVN